MNKRITSLMLCFVMVFAMLATAVPALAMSTEAPITVTIDPDKTTASPGDTITYTVNVGPVKRLQSVNFTLVIPEGLTYVSGKEVVIGAFLRSFLGTAQEKAQRDQDHEIDQHDDKVDRLESRSRDLLENVHLSYV